jgi:plastocyanin
LPVEDKEIHIGDTVLWRNLEDRRRPHNLVNENGLWDNPQNLPYLRSITYTFNKTGTYTFYLQGYEKRKMVIRVI